MIADETLLRVRDLTVSFPVGRRDVPVVQGLDLELGKGRTLGIVGESGSGKSMTSLAVMGLLPPRAAVTGSIVFDGTELVGAGERRLRSIRGDRIAMVFQDPLSCLNPYYTVGTQIAEAYRSHRTGVSRRQARKVAVEAMERVHIRHAARRVDEYPHQFSGGMRQRVMIAMALCTDPELIIADEPTTALDVTVQAQILDLLEEVRQESGAALVLITHDLAVVSRVAEEIVVMRSGVVVERGTAREVFSDPRHEYTRALLDAVPRIDDRIEDLRAVPRAGRTTSGSVVR
ncbi:ABC transporter ATP-binding protein [Paenibacillus sp. TRM 82003]|uniref:ABC transporter ATP-binding protein n=1 Tax=Kineococcus sp. TRM81007 TaxID=2925831 RepID=UPI001F5A2317|nr:ABC transporter ATP-binding protein [Kineococcus sp. TRM81007]MCI2239568.1 ABC transporter ATP-binding protein [Kineococcus sp. TRM81007]MCI3926150.1 ABC transporter ATP-binding protein [Paenibacillus sp. TRM 82003]